MHIAIIPARSGSKGLADKNIMLLKGKPLIAYTIESAIDSGCFDEIYVSTDSEKYADIAKAYGASVPFLRNEENAKDGSSSWDVVREALRKYEEAGKYFDKCMLLQPTSPLRTANDIKNAFELLEQREKGSIVSVCETDHPVQWCFRLSEENSMREFGGSGDRNKSRQELEPYFRENGAIYLVAAEKIKDIDFDIYKSDCYGYVMPRERSVDIDGAFDFMQAEVLLNHMD